MPDWLRRATGAAQSGEAAWGRPPPGVQQEPDGDDDDEGVDSDDEIDIGDELDG